MYRMYRIENIHRVKLIHLCIILMITNTIIYHCSRIIMTLWSMHRVVNTQQFPIEEKKTKWKSRGSPVHTSADQGLLLFPNPRQSSAIFVVKRICPKRENINFSQISKDSPFSLQPSSEVLFPAKRIWSQSSLQAISRPRWNRQMRRRPHLTMGGPTFNSCMLCGVRGSVRGCTRPQ